MTSEPSLPGPCGAARPVLGELALGALTGRERSEAVAHLERCVPCRAELDRLAAAADALLELAPEAEPPLGFELAVAQRARRGLQPGREARRARLAAAALVLVSLGTGAGLLGAGLASGGRPAPSAFAARLTSSGAVRGEVLLSAGPPTWLVMVVQEGSWSEPVACRVTLTDGRVETVGHFALRGGSGTWAVALSVPPATVRRAELVGAGGAVLASATLPG